MSADEDEANVARVLAGDAAAFEPIVRRWQAPLINMAYRFCHDRGRAEDMAQEAFLRAFRGLGTWRKDAAFSTWLFALASNFYRSEIGQGQVVSRAGHPSHEIDALARTTVMNPDDLDRVLASETDIVPSSGFVSSVMDAVAAEATTPPLPFPWQRAWPLAVCLAAAIGWLIALRSEPQSIASGPDLYAWFEMIVPMATEWVAAGLVTSLVVTVLSLRMTRVR